MPDITGVELGAGTCVLARACTDGGSVRISAVHLMPVRSVGRPPAELADTLRQVRRSGRFPRRARVVAWDLHPGATLGDAGTQALLTPLVAAGFHIQQLLTPPGALVALARHHQLSTPADATACLALNCDRVAIAIVQGDDLLYSREFAWSHRKATSGRDELLERYSLAMHLTEELRQGLLALVQQGRTAGRMLICGNLPNLRSLAMPLIEEFDIEVETLDSLDGLNIPPKLADEVREHAPAVRLAWAAAGQQSATEIPLLPGFSKFWLNAWTVRTAAAAAAVAVLTFGAIQFTQPTDGTRTKTEVPQATSRTAGSPPAGGASSPRITETESSPAGLSSRTARSADQMAAAATTGRQGALPPDAGERSGHHMAAVPEQRAAQGPARRAAPPESVLVQSGRNGDRRPLVPLDAPLPIVNSILAAPGRRIAVVDGEIVREGDAVGQRVLIRIEPDAVVLREPSGYEVRVPLRRRVGGG